MTSGDLKTKREDYAIPDVCSMGFELEENIRVCGVYDSVRRTGINQDKKNRMIF
jgi:hypothetical protein